MVIPNAYEDVANDSQRWDGWDEDAPDEEEFEEPFAVGVLNDVADGQVYDDDDFEDEDLVEISDEVEVSTDEASTDEVPSIDDDFGGLDDFDG